MGRTPILRSLVSARVRTAIDRAGQSQVGVSELTGIPRETLRRRLLDINPFTIDELEQIAEALGLAPDAFLDSRRWQEAS